MSESVRDANSENGHVLRQALVSGVVVGVILFTMIGAIWLTYALDGAGATPFVVAVSSPAAPGVSPEPSPLAAVKAPTSQPTAPLATVPPINTPTVVVVASPTPTPVTPTNTPTPCRAPAGWQSYLVQPGDDLLSLAFRCGFGVDTISEGNCLPPDAQLTPGGFINLPVVLPTAAPCTRPPDWLRYVVRQGDTLEGLAQLCGIIPEIVRVDNCLPAGYVLTPGETIYLPCDLSKRFTLPTPTPQRVWPTPAYRTPTPYYYPYPTPAYWTPAPWPTPIPYPTRTPRPTLLPTAQPTVQPTLPPLPSPTPGGVTPIPTQLPTAIPTEPVQPTPIPTQPPIPTPVPTQPPIPTPVPTLPPAPTPIPTQPPILPTIPPISTPTPQPQ